MGDLGEILENVKTKKHEMELDIPENRKIDVFKSMDVSIPESRKSMLKSEFPV